MTHISVERMVNANSAADLCKFHQSPQLSTDSFELQQLPFFPAVIRMFFEVFMKEYHQIKHGDRYSLGIYVVILQKAAFLCIKLSTMRKYFKSWYNWTR